MKLGREMLSGKVNRPANWALVLLLGLGSCGGSGEDVSDAGAVALLEGKFAEKWEAIGIPDEGEIGVNEEGVLRMGAGKPMTGVVFSGGDDFELPTKDYVVEFEARRVEGSDLFAALTFPVGSEKTCATLVLGGWGGSLVGISSIDHLDASENTTRAEIPFENGRWYAVKLVVTEAKIRVWIDGKIVVNAAIAGRVIGMRAGDIERCMPFGFATFWSVGEVRKLTLGEAERGGE